MHVLRLVIWTMFTVCSVGFAADSKLSDERTVAESSPVDLSAKSGAWRYEVVEWNGNQHGLLTFTTGRVGCETPKNDNCGSGIRPYLQAPWLSYQRCSYALQENSGRGNYDYSVEAPANRPNQELILKWFAWAPGTFSTSSVFVSATFTWIDPGASDETRAHFCNIPRDDRRYYYYCSSNMGPKCDAAPPLPWGSDGKTVPMPPQSVDLTGGG